MRTLNRVTLSGLLMVGLATANSPAHAAAGSLDPTFGNKGIVVTAFTNPKTHLPFSVSAPISAALQSNGDIVVATNFSGQLGVARYLSNGRLDATFGTGGFIVPQFDGLTGDGAVGMTIQTNGQTLVAGDAEAGSTPSELALVRFNTNGTLDITFGSGGLVTTKVPNTLSASVEPQQQYQCRGAGVGPIFVAIEFRRTAGSVEA